MVHWRMRASHWRAMLWAARVFAGLAATFLGVAVFLTSPPAAGLGSVTGHSQSVILTYCSLALVAVGFVIVVGPDKINEIAKRDRR